ncbi:hypothetical protein CXF68_04475 [Tenacibaculum sp. Bg11-29]|uniref:hypothetical protein n=1 Tax=Tenacibaculum sp. Bg11-29 TaxID=2058306 RepID=UPI000C3363DC|nr:hypothetical protein [Tenacibaculum sp. Bg11-29]PKH50003.1 hypothetical protein CXF68_04475 [Tenacibaculum sp. Bg11-29]
MELSLEEVYLTEEEAVALARKALKDIGHWEEFKIEKGRVFEKTPPYDYNHWLVSFNFTKDDWRNGEVTPMVVVNDEDQLVTFVSWKKSNFLLSYNESKDEYYHSELSR